MMRKTGCLMMRKTNWTIRSLENCYSASWMIRLTRTMTKGLNLIVMKMIGYLRIQNLAKNSIQKTRTMMKGCWKIRSSGSWKIRS